MNEVLTYEALKAERDALAVESAAMRSEILNITFMDDEVFFSCDQRAQELMGRLVNIKTPATDAAIAANQAQGVDKACRWNIDDEYGVPVAITQQRTSTFNDRIQSDRTANTAFIAAANPAVVLALPAELEAKTDFSDKAIERISGLEKACDKYLRQTKKAERELLAAKERLAELEAKLATPVRLPTTYGRLGVAYTRVIPEVIEAIRAAGFKFDGGE